MMVNDAVHGAGKFRGILYRGFYKHAVVKTGDFRHKTSHL
jgi:hypothetical protein